MLTMNVGHGQWPGSGAANCLEPGPRQRAHRAADEYRGQFATVETEHKPK